MKKMNVKKGFYALLWNAGTVLAMLPLLAWVLMPDGTWIWFEDLVP
ncbi:MAG: hypothetical protein LBM06_09470 [Prevotellaceae bacterium]|jgi:hypothetical protein|nr:hypothetical protein [Prevotellaceae bacterium]